MTVVYLGDVRHAVVQHLFHMQTRNADLRHVARRSAPQIMRREMRDVPFVGIVPHGAGEHPLGVGRILFLGAVLERLLTVEVSGSYEFRGPG